MKRFVLVALIAILGSVNVDGYTRRGPQYNRWGHRHNHWSPQQWSPNMTSPDQLNLPVESPQFPPNLPPGAPHLPPDTPYSLPKPPNFGYNWLPRLTHLQPNPPPGLPLSQPNMPNESPQFQDNQLAEPPQFQTDWPQPLEFQPVIPAETQFQPNMPPNEPPFQPNLPFGSPPFPPKLPTESPEFQPNLARGPLNFQHNLPPGPPQSLPNRPPRPLHYQSYWPHRPPSHSPDWPSQIIVIPSKPQKPWNLNEDRQCGIRGCYHSNNGYHQQPNYASPNIEASIEQTPKAESTTMPIEQCELQCPLTSDYNPVCGTNDVTYDNIRYLQCAQLCGIDVQVKCEKSCNECNLEDSPPESTEVQLQQAATVQNCINMCKTPQTYLPVCGTNNVTYENIEKLLCSKHCGLNVDVQKTSECTPSLITPKQKDYKYFESFDQCMSRCPMNINIDHVCGTDNQTYMNIDRLNCAKVCGKDVEVLCRQPCVICGQLVLQPKPSVTEPSVVMTTMSIEQCTDICPRSEKYNYVCGTNNVTYDNFEHLQCAQMCGEKVQALCYQKCNVCNLSDQSSELTETSTVTSTSTFSTSTIPTTTTEPSSSAQTTISTDIPTIQTTTNVSKGITANLTEEAPISREYLEECMAQSCPTASTYEPICGSNNFTYNNPTHIVCAQTCGEIVIGLWFGPCYFDINSSSISTPSNSASTTEVSNTVHIDDDVWGKIFGTTAPSTYLPPHTPRSMTQSNEYGFDER